jgi:glycosyltransferase involved in cell wall biosynthesis
MNVSVLINSYNYSDYVCDSIRSVLSQTRRPDEIIVVDDGSTDGSVELIETEFKDEPLIHVISKGNRGQLSAFNIGFTHSRGELIFFLDADDLFCERYIERAADFYQRYPECDFLYCGTEKFGALSEVDLSYSKNRDHGFSIIEAILCPSWRGGPTSSLAIRRTILEAFLPLDLEDDWPTRADDCLAIGSAVVGARKFFLAESLVRYQIHDRNAWYGRRFSSGEIIEREHKLDRLVSSIAAGCGYDAPSLLDNLLDEFESAGTGRDIHELVRYVKIAYRSDRSLAWRSLQLVQLGLLYLKMLASGRTNELEQGE